MSSKRPHDGSMSNKRLRSEVWEHFDKAPDGERAICKYCGKSLGAISTRGTSHLLRHPCIKNLRGDVSQPVTVVESNHEAINVGDVGQLVTLESNHEARSVGLTRDAIWKYQVEQAIRKDVLFDSSDRKKYWSDLTGLLDIEKEISTYYELEKKKLAVELKNLTSRVSFSFQIMKELGYISITAHFIKEDFNLMRRLIGFKKLDDIQSELCIVDAIKKCISDWKLDGKIFTFIGGNISSDMKINMLECFSSKLLLNGRFILTECHKEALANFYCYWIGPLFYQVKLNIDKAVRHVKGAPNRMVIFNKIAEEKGLPPINIDWLNEYAGCSWGVDSKDPVHWKPAVEMFKQTLAYKDVFNRYAEIAGPSMTVNGESLMLDNGHSSQLYNIGFSYPGTHEVNQSPLSELNMCSIDWKIVEEAVHFSDLMLQVIDGLSTSNYPTSNLYIPYLVQIKDIQCEAIVFEKSHREKTYDLDYYFNGTLCDDMSRDLFQKANVLDPRYKLILAEYYYQEFIDLVDWDNLDEHRKTFEEIFCTYANNKMDEGSPVCIENTNTQEQGPLSIPAHIIGGKIANFYKYVKENKRTRKYELYEYLDDELVDLYDASFNILSWWKQNRSQYPVLSRMARDLLAVPTCVHSIEDFIKSDFKLLEDLNPQLVEAVICSKDWILSDVQSVPEMGS